MNRAILGIFVAVCAAPAFADGPSAREWAKRAEAALGAGEFEKALEAYKQAEVTMPTSPELAYNRGVAHYKLGQYDDAREYFSKALSTRDLSLEAKCKFNLGNVAYASALGRLTDLQQAIDLAKTAMGRYRDALELDPTDEDARENIEKAQLFIKDLLDKLKKQQEEQQQDQQQQQSDDNEDSSGQRQDGEQEQQDQHGDGGEDDRQQQDQQGSPEQEEQEAREEQQQPAEAREMTREEAERMLQAVRDRERQRREELSKRRMLRRDREVKDW